MARNASAAATSATTADQESVAAAAIPVPAGSVAAAVSLSNTGSVHAGGLRELLDCVPPEFCCALDGKLLVDPIRAPSGYVFERSVLQRALLDSGGLCPI